MWQGTEDLVVVHDALDFGHCRLSLAVCCYPGAFMGSSLVNKLKFIFETVNLCDQVPKEGIFENIITLEDLLKMPEWTEERPLRVVTGFGYV